MIHQTDLFYDFTKVTTGNNTSTGSYTINNNISPGYATINSTSGTTYQWATTNNTNPWAQTITIADDTYSNKSTLQVNGNANFEGDVKIKGKSLIESLEKIEEKLAILRPNTELESKWDELRELRKKYVELEKEIIEKEKIWDILKK